MDTDSRLYLCLMARPEASTKGVHSRMSTQRTQGTTPELQVRSQLHALGLRFRLHRQPIKGLRRTADIVFGPSRVVVMVDGCFWHSCPDHGTRPQANGQWWEAKLRRNAERDRETDERLSAEGWRVVRVWEHEDPVAAAARVRDVVEERRI